MTDIEIAKQLFHFITTIIYMWLGSQWSINGLTNIIVKFIITICFIWGGIICLHDSGFIVKY